MWGGAAHNVGWGHGLFTLTRIYVTLYVPSRQPLWVDSGVKVGGDQQQTRMRHTPSSTPHTGPHLLSLSRPA